MDLNSLLASRLEKFRWGGGAFATALCPFHKDVRPSLSINMERRYFSCFGCQESGTLKSLLRRLGVSYDLLEDIKSLPPRKYTPQLKRELYLPDYILSAYDSCPKSLLKAGFSKSLLQSYEIGFDRYGYKITFPVRSIDGKLAAISGRVLQDVSPKYEFYTYKSEFPDYHPYPKDHLWGADKVMGKVETGVKIPFLVICEGFKASMWVASFGYSCVALMGTAATKSQKEIISLFYLPTILMLDNNDPGRAGTAKLCKEISTSVPKLRVVDYSGDPREQPDDFNQNEVSNMLDSAKSPLELEVHSWTTQRRMD